ncbi:MAG: hypothetical protein AB1427_17185 [Thermodesulfobacteriota bacterium]
MARREWSWTANRKAQADSVNEVVNELREYWPLTLRQVYYRLVVKEIIENTRSRYIDLSRLVKFMRIDGLLDWDAIEDRTRRVSRKRGQNDSDEYLKEEIDIFLSGYQRCYVQGQDSYVEVWFEKDALSRIFEDVAWYYCIRAVVCRGYQSVTFLKEYRDRALRAKTSGQLPVILYFGDFDPSGMQMFEATQETLEKEMELTGVLYQRIALNLGDIHEYKLPHNPDAVKKSDRRYQKFVKEYGHYAVELDALHPATLKRITSEAVEAQFDMDLFREQKEIERMERKKLADLKNHVLKSIEDWKNRNV